MEPLTRLADNDRGARVTLNALVLPDDAVTGRLVASVGAVETVRLLIGHGPIPGVELVRGELWRRRSLAGDYSAKVDQVMAAAAHGRYKIVMPGEPGWPVALDDLGQRAPLMLWAKGRLELLESASNAVTITGTRDSTGYGEHVATDLAAEVAREGRVVVSGGAYGIDAAAHRAALAVKGSTVAVMSSGLDRFYPAGNETLLQLVSHYGAVVSEVPPGAVPSRERFAARHRLLAALSGATVVVEAEDRWGSLLIAQRAVELGRPVGAVPGPVTSASSAGTNRLLRDGAACVITEAHDIDALLGVPGLDAPPSPAFPSPERSTPARFPASRSL
jgi:DNA processing protein